MLYPNMGFSLPQLPFRDLSAGRSACEFQLSIHGDGAYVYIICIVLIRCSFATVHLLIPNTVHNVIWHLALCTIPAINLHLSCYGMPTVLSYYGMLTVLQALELSLIRSIVLFVIYDR